MNEVRELVSEREVLSFQVEEARRALSNLNLSIAEDERLLRAHHQARLDVAVSLAVKEARLEEVRAELAGLRALAAEEEEGVYVAVD